MRLGEAEQVVSLFRNAYNIPLVHVDASDKFLAGLAGVTDPEAKRKFIGGAFIDLFEAEAKKVGGADFLAQGTLYPDVIESVSFTGGPSVTIKSHHNVGGLPERMNMKLRRGSCASSSRTRCVHWVANSACPGSSSAGIRFRAWALPSASPARSRASAAISCARPMRSISRRSRNAGLYDAIWQAFAVLLPVRTVGVMGDYRTYDNVLALRAVTSTDGMTADIYPFEAAFLSRVATRIINEVKGINRVVYDYTSKPPGTIEWE